MSRVVGVFVASLVLAFILPSAEAQRGWLITGGQGWGPIRLDMTDQDVLPILGQPQRQDNAAFWHRWYYAGATLWFDLSNYRLSAIHVNDSTSVTREGIRIGSPLSAVLRTYGDSIDAGNSQGSECLESSVNGQPDYRTPHLTLRYVKHGIQFQILLDGRSVPSVTLISTWRIGECKSQ